jgi:hypothetical protein
MDQQQLRRGPSGAQGGSTVYGLGLIGAMVWYWKQATGFRGHTIGVLKAMVWPAVLVYGALKALND